MNELTVNQRKAVSEAAVQLLTRAENSRGLGLDDVLPRISDCVIRYLTRDNAHADSSVVRNFVRELRIDDLCLILACESGDETAWSELLQQFDATVKSAARKICTNAEDADDLASSIWAELYGLRTDSGGKRKSKLSYYSGRGSLGGWLRAVVAQLAVDQFRKQSKFVQLEEERDFDAAAADTALSSGYATQAPDPEEELTVKRTASDIAKALAEAIAALEPEDRLILKLYYFDELKLKQIAASFGYHEATASRRLARLQSEIRKSVEKSLRAAHGWTDVEVKRHLAETASGLGVNLETMFKALIVTALMQVFGSGGVL